MSSVTTARPGAPALPDRTDALRLLGRYGTLLVLATMITVVSLLEPATFPTASNVINVLNQSALTALIAMGLTLPLVAGEFDLSVGYSASLCGVIAAELMQHGLGIPLAFLAAVAAGLVIGLVNGLIVTRIGVNAMVATLGVGTYLFQGGLLILGVGVGTLARQHASR